MVGRTCGRFALVMVLATPMPVLGGPGALRWAAGATVAAVTATVVARAGVGGLSPAAVAPLPGPDWRAPVGGRLQVLRPFDESLGRYSAGHRGVDLAAAAGQPVLAAGDGVVVYAGLLGDRGVVSIEHGGLRTSYEPVTAAVVRGQRVEAGQVVGTVEPLGHACASTCLHWGLRRGEDYLDPLRLLTRVSVRLLPVLGVPIP